MENFASHRLNLLADGTYELVLYLNYRTEIGRIPGRYVPEDPEQTQQRIDNYIKKYLPNVKITSVRVMLGSILVTSILVAYPGIIGNSDTQINNHQPGTKNPVGDNYPKPIPTHPITKPQPQPPSQSDTSKPSVTTAPNLGTKLVLVNKKYQLAADYIPDNLVAPQVPFSFAEDLPQRYMKYEAARALERLFYQAEQEGIKLTAVSGYRSYKRQAEIYARNSANSPDANRFSARPGQSEHQTGWAMDVTSPSLGQLTQAFGNTPEGQWLRIHAADFGFIIRYPEGKEMITGYAYEPWHLRYVGLEAAGTINNSGIALEEYLGLQ